MNMDGKPDLPLSVAEDHGLGDGQSVVQITKSIKLPLLPFYCHKELLYPLQSQLITEGVTHSNRMKTEYKETFSVDNSYHSYPVKLSNGNSPHI